MNDERTIADAITITIEMRAQSLDNLGTHMSDNPRRSDIDLGSFADPTVQGFQVWRYADGDQDKVAQFHAELLAEQTAGWCTILYMDDRLAVVQWNDAFVLTLNPDHPLVVCALSEGV